VDELLGLYMKILYCYIGLVLFSAVTYSGLMRDPRREATTVLWPFFWDHWVIRCQKRTSGLYGARGRLTEADTLTIWLVSTPSGLTSAHLHHTPYFFYGPDALSAAQPKVSKH